MGRAKYTVFSRVTGVPLPRPVFARMDLFAGRLPTFISHLASRDIATERKTVTSVHGPAEYLGFLASNSNRPHKSRRTGRGSRRRYTGRRSPTLAEHIAGYGRLVQPVWTSPAYVLTVIAKSWETSPEPERSVYSPVPLSTSHVGVSCSFSGLAKSTRLWVFITNVPDPSSQTNSCPAY